MKPHTHLITTSIFNLILFFAMIFILAGKINYWQGWFFVVYNLIMAIALMNLFKHSPALAKERLRPGAGIKFWDKLIMAGIGISTAALLIVAILDSARFHWTNPRQCIYIIAYVALTISIIGLAWPMYVNRFFSSMVRIQKDRKQKVVTEGPYRIVRHPGYAAGLLMFPSIPLTLGSYIALPISIIPIILLIIRTYLEDTTLKAELKGYKKYAEKVRYRLIPWVW